MRHALSLFLLLMLLLCFAAPMLCMAEDAAQAEETMPYSRVITIPGAGERQYYAQNDPRWNKSYYEPYEHEQFRRFGEGGCGPTALAIAVANQLSPEELTHLVEHKNRFQIGFYYCPCSVNHFHCYEGHERMLIETPEDFLDKLPLVFAGYATGNNDDKRKYRTTGDGTSLTMFQMLAADYDLEYVGTNDWEEAKQALRDGYSIITTVVKGVFTPTSHYMVLAHVEDGWVYVLDPYMQTTYDRDINGRLEVLEPGLVRFREEDMWIVGLYGFYMIRKPQAAPAPVSEMP